MAHKFIGGAASSAVPSLDEVAQLMSMRGIEGIAPESVCKRVVRYRASDSRVDSHGDVILANAWDVEEWLANPQFLLNHNAYDVKNILGRGLDAKSTANGLFCDVFFFPPEMATSEQTEAVFKLVKAGVFTDCSVGFHPKRNGYHWPSPEEEKVHGTMNGVVFTSVTLKELSAVTIGANIGAKVTATAKMLGNLTEGELKSLQQDEATALMIDLAIFRTKGPTPQVPGIEVLASTIADLTKQVGEANRTSEMLRNELAKKNQTVLTEDDIAEAINKIGEAADILAKNLPPDGTPAPEKTTSNPVIRNISETVEKLESHLKN